MAEMEFPDLEWVVDVTSLPREGVEYRFEADPEMRAKLADALDLLSLDRFAVRVKVSSRKKRRFHVAGELNGEVVQACVVTLKPVNSVIAANFDRLLIAQDNPDRQTADGQTPREIVFDPTEDDPPDVFDGNEIDIGLIAVEELALQLDPYPRHPSADQWVDKEYSAASEEFGQEGKKSNLFAALGKLKTD
ncbi:MAG: DUF177 domain-containing protein [Fimbriimonadaceae bacterium]|nr:DUF177 domain-containing protein [Alphaproteobacteria bacterium]